MDKYLNAGVKDVIQEFPTVGEILYPWIDRGLSDTQVGRLFSRFSDVDREFAGEPARYEDFIRRTEQILSSTTA